MSVRWKTRHIKTLNKRFLSFYQSVSKSLNGLVNLIGCVNGAASKAQQRSANGAHGYSNPYRQGRLCYSMVVLKCLVVCLV